VIKKIVISAFILFLVIIFGWFQFKDPYMRPNDANMILIENVRDMDISRGMELYIDNCASCHMDNLAGNSEWKSSLDDDGQRFPPPLNGTGHTWHHAPQQLFVIIRYGYKKMDSNYQGKMLENKDLRDEEIWSIIKYIKEMWPENIRAKYNANFGE